MALAVWINCSAYNNGTYNYSCPGKLRVKDSLVIINSISVGSSGTNLATSLFTYHVTDDSWMSQYTAASASDFVSLDTTGVRADRKADGSLPDITFMHLSSTCQFRAAGTTELGATSTDLGAFAYQESVTDVAGPASSTPSSFSLSQNFPNPFNPSTTIRYALSSQSRVTMKVYSILGQEVATLVDGIQDAGYHQILWQASHLASGAYLVRITAASTQVQGGSFTQVKKMLLMK